MLQIGLERNIMAVSSMATFSMAVFSTAASSMAASLLNDGLDVWVWVMWRCKENIDFQGYMAVTLKNTCLGMAFTKTGNAVSQNWKSLYQLLILMNSIIMKIRFFKKKLEKTIKLIVVALNNHNFFFQNKTRTVNRFFNFLCKNDDFWSIFFISFYKTFNRCFFIIISITSCARIFFLITWIFVLMKWRQNFSSFWVQMLWIKFFHWLIKRVNLTHVEIVSHTHCKYFFINFLIN